MISFKGGHFKKTIILMAIRWSLAYSLSYRDIEELIFERGISVDRSTDKSGANNLALKHLNQSTPKDNQIEIRQIKYLNNIVEQDHRFIKKITKPTNGFKSFQSAHATLIGIELHHMLRKKQHQNAANMPVFEQFYTLAA